MDQCGGRPSLRPPYQEEAMSEFSSPTSEPQAKDLSKVEGRDSVAGKRTQVEGGAGVVRAFGLSSGVDGAAAPASDAIAGKGAGAPLPGAVADTASRAYGADVSDVRVHSDASAVSAASSLGAEAFTHGSDVYLGGGHQPGTDHGNFVMMHELAHVVQGRGAPEATQAKLEVGESNDPAEQEADQAAHVAMQGGTTTITPRSGKLRRFEAGTVKYNPKAPPGSDKFKVEEGGHAFLTANALKTMGLTNDEAAQSYQGNWMRDLSQVYVPGLTSKISAAHVMPFLQIISIKEFGHGFDEKEFGTYDPVEHIDNPTDLRASDVFQQYPPETSVPVAKVQNVGQGALDHPDNFDDPSKTLTPAGSENQAYGDVDDRYKATALKNKNAINKKDALPFQMNATGVPNYINTSKEWCKSTLRKAASEGRGDIKGLDDLDKNLSPEEKKRHEDAGGDPKGPRDFASGIHTMQDYYAHSNFCEVSINTLIKEGKLSMPNDAGKLEKIDSKLRVDSKVKKNDAQGNPLTSINMKVGDLPGFDKAKDKNAEREVISTGSFNLTDTAVSLLYVVKDKVLDLNPFAQKGQGPSPLANAALDYLDMEKPAGFNKVGKAIGGILHPLGTAIKNVGSGAATVVQGAGNFAGGVAKGAGAIGGGFFDILNKGNALLGGDADYWNKEKHAVEGAGNSAGNAITGETDATAKKIREITSWLDNKATELDGRQHILRDLYAWFSGIDLLAPLKAMARAIPVLGSTIGDLIDTAQKELHELAEALLGELWIAATKMIIGKLQDIIEWLKAQTNIKDKKKAGKPGKKAGPELLPEFMRTFLGDKQAELEKMLGGVGDMYDDAGHPKNAIAPGSYTPPSHSEVAKDHHAKDPAVQAAAEPQEAEGPDGADVDGGDWLNSLAEKLAQAASNAIGAKVAAAWDQVRDTGHVTPDAIKAVDDAVEHYFQHPDDCRDTWMGPTSALFQNPAFAARLRKELAKGNT
jgi:Domain of unknown function (DUF4157)/Heterokaryon incompatibility protein Het-C